MICCAKDCKHQREGYCKLNTMSMVGPPGEYDECVYFQRGISHAEAGDGRLTMYVDR